MSANCDGTDDISTDCAGTDCIGTGSDGAGSSRSVGTDGTEAALLVLLVGTFLPLLCIGVDKRCGDVFFSLYFHRIRLICFFFFFILSFLVEMELKNFCLKFFEFSIQ